ncbi:MAG: hypothetical protein FWF56_00710 [Firmicutes bacterium]|nr:hypothetical protein [Bacillota bacterium]MCL1953741.1 hypothetical protein [Bacillota bacterium]
MKLPEYFSETYIDVYAFVSNSYIMFSKEELSLFQFDGLTIIFELFKKIFLKIVRKLELFL